MDTREFSNISFSSKSIFGHEFNPGIKASVCVVGSLLNYSYLKINGTIHPSKVSNMKKSDIWSYIYYLWYYNRAYIDVFSKMTNRDKKQEKASAQTFLSGLYPYLEKSGGNETLASVFRKERLVNALNKIIESNEDISIPILQRLYKQLINSGKIPGLPNTGTTQDIEVSTRPNNKQVVSPSLDVKVDQFQLKSPQRYNTRLTKNTDNSDIKVQFGINLVPKK
jgi:hypothetical protein